MLYNVQNPQNISVNTRGPVIQSPPQYARQPQAQQSALGNLPQTALQGVQIYDLVSGAGSSATGGAAGGATGGVAGGTAGSATGGAAGGTTGGAAGGLGALGWVAGLAAAVYADEKMARNVAGTENDPEAAWENNVRGITRYGGMTPGQTALIERGIGKDKLDRFFDPTGILKKIEGPIAEATAGTLPELFGGTGNLDPIGSFLLS